MGTPEASSVADPTLPDGRLADACYAAQRLHVVLEDLIQHRDTRHDDSGRSATVSHASPPWNARVAYLIFDLAQLVRGLEANLHLMISGSVFPRGGSDRNTQLALGGLPNLALAVDQEVTSLVANQVEAWCHQVREVIGEVEPLTRAPRKPGQPEPRCPWCQRQTLRVKVQAGQVLCVNPVCRDDEGNRSTAWAEVIETVPVLRWRSGSTTTWS